MHWWTNKARSWLLWTLTFRIIWIHQSICKRLPLPLYNTHPTWLSLLNERKCVDWRHQINSLVNLLLLINKFSFICEGQSCRVRIPRPRVHSLRSFQDTGHWNFPMMKTTGKPSRGDEDYWIQWWRKTTVHDGDHLIFIWRYPTAGNNSYGHARKKTFMTTRVFIFIICYYTPASFAIKTKLHNCMLTISAFYPLTK